VTNYTRKPTAIICLSPNNGGMEIDAIKLATKLSSYSKITLIAKKDSFIESQKSTYIDKNILLETISFRHSISMNIMLYARNILLKNDIKNIVFFGASELKSLYFSFLGLNINLIIRHGTTKSKPKKDFFHKLIYSNVNYHVSISKHLEENVKHIIPFTKKSKSKLIYPSLNFNKVQHITNNVLTIVHIGRIVKGKGQADAIKACEILIKNNIDFSFNIIGGLDENYRNEFLNIYENCLYKKKINLIGFTNDVESYLQSADIFLFPSYGEGFGNAFLEALANNIVCITYNNTTFPEFMQMQVYFELCKNKNIQELKEKLLDVALNLDTKKEYTKKNNKILQNVFSVQNEVNHYLDILE